MFIQMLTNLVFYRLVSFLSSFLCKFRYYFIDNMFFANWLICYIICDIILSFNSILLNMSKKKNIKH